MLNLTCQECGAAFVSDRPWAKFCATPASRLGTGGNIAKCGEWWRAEREEKRKKS